VLGAVTCITVRPSFYLECLRDLGLSRELVVLLTSRRDGAGTLLRFALGRVSNRIGVAAITLSGFAIGGLAPTMTPFLTTVPLLPVVVCLGEAADRLSIPGVYTMVAVGTEQGGWALAVAIAPINLSSVVTSTVASPILGMTTERITPSVTFW